MTSPAAPLDETPTHDAILRGVGGWARPLMERDLAVLGRLRDAALAVAEAVAAQVQAQARYAVQIQATPDTPEAEPPPPPPLVITGDPVLGFARASRAVRMTVGLRTRLIDDIERLDELQGRRAENRGAEARTARKAQLGRLLTRIIHDAAYAPTAADAAQQDGHDTAPATDTAEAERADSEGPEPDVTETEGVERLETERESYVRLCNAATERLKDKDRVGDVLNSPLSALIDQVCRDLGLAPDWRRLAEEAWARQEIDSGAVGAPLAAVLLGQSPPPQAARRKIREALVPPTGEGGGIEGGGADRPEEAADVETASESSLSRNGQAEAPPIPAVSPSRGERVQEAPPPPAPPPPPDDRWAAPPIPPPLQGLPGEMPPPRRRPVSTPYWE